MDKKKLKLFAFVQDEKLAMFDEMREINDKMAVLDNLDVSKMELMKGDIGETGEQGPQGEQGVQGEQGEAGPQGEAGENGKDGKDGVNGVTQDPVTGEMVRDLLSTLKEDARLDASILKNLPTLQQLTDGVLTSQKFNQRVPVIYPSKNSLDQRWHGAGLSTVKEEGTTLTTKARSMDFVGTGVTATSNAEGDVTVTVTADIVGPGSSTDNAIVRWDGTTGKLIQNSNSILSDAGSQFLATNLLVAGSNDTLSISSVGFNFEVSSDTNSGFPIGVLAYSNKNFINPFTDELGGAPARVAELIITGGTFNQHSFFTGSDSSPVVFQGFIGTTTPTRSVITFTGSKLGAAGSTAGLSATEHFMSWSTPGNAMMNVYGDGTMVFTGKIAYDNSLAYPTSSSIYWGRAAGGSTNYQLFNVPTVTGAFNWMIAETVAMNLTTPGAAGITAADVIAQLQVGNNIADTYNFSKTSATVYVSNAYPTAVSNSSSKGAVFKGAQTTGSNLTNTTTSGIAAISISETTSFNAGFIYGAQFQAQGKNLGGSIESLVANYGLANFVSTHQGNITNSITGVLGTAQANATGASASGTIPIMNGVWGQIFKSTTDKLTVTEANGVLSGQGLINSAIATYYGFHFKEDTGAGVITTEYGLYLEAVTRGTTSVGAYIGGGTTLALWVDTGTTRLDGNLLIGATTAGASMTNGISMASGTDPSGNVTDAFQFYSSDTVAGNATPHFRTENGTVINLFKSAAYTITNVTTDRSYDANSTTLDEIADTLGTLIADLQVTGLIG